MSSEGSPAGGPVTRAYLERIAQDGLSRDEGQLALARRFDLLAAEIDAAPARGRGLLGRLLKPVRPAPITGLYIHGGVGRGKTMMMDLFYASLATPSKRRAHFNDFMADVHDRIGRHREALKRGDTKEADPVPPVARALAAEARVLCFDEFAVTDIADAMILSRLFTALFGEGVVLVATSNVAPRDLYRDGLNRALFLPFIDTLEAHAQVVALDTGRDYRLEKLSRLPVYMTPCDAEAARLMDAAWATASEGHGVAPRTIEVKGRRVEVPRAAGRAARFSFEALCARPLGARDYLALADAFDTILVDCIPQMGIDRRNEAKRLILFVDVAYDRQIRLIASAEARPQELYKGTVGTEAFEFARTVSRLTEMQSADWGAERAAPGSN